MDNNILILVSKASDFHGEENCIKNLLTFLYRLRITVYICGHSATSKHNIVVARDIFLCAYITVRKITDERFLTFHDSILEQHIRITGYSLQFPDVVYRNVRCFHGRIRISLRTKRKPALKVRCAKQRYRRNTIRFPESLSQNLFKADYMLSIFPFP